MKLPKSLFLLIFTAFSAVCSVPANPACLAKAASTCLANKAVLDAAQKGQLDKIQRLISPATIDCGNQNGITSLMFAAYYGQFPIVQFLLGKQANANLVSGNNQDFNFGKLLSNRNSKTTALMLACFAGKLEIVVALLKAGAQVNAQDSDGQTALIYAILGDKNWPHRPLSITRKKIIIALLDFGANPNKTDNNGLDAAYYYAHVAGLVPYGDHYEKDADLADKDDLLLRMK